MSCCSNPTNLGCYHSCETVVISSLTNYDGNKLAVKYNFNGAVRKQLIINVDGNGSPIIDLSLFNEDYTYTFEIIVLATGVSLGCFSMRVDPCAGDVDVEQGCISSDCPLGREISYLSVIEEINSRVAGTMFYVSLDGATFIDLESQIAPAAAYGVQWGDGSGAEPFGFVSELGHDVASLADGVYYGYVYESYSNAMCGFWYQVSSGVVTEFQINRTVEVDVALTCVLYPDYTNDVTDESEISGGFNIASSDIYIYGIEVNAETYGGAVLLYNESGQLLSSLQNVGSQIVSRYKLSNGTFISNTIILRTRCITA